MHSGWSEEPEIGGHSYKGILRGVPRFHFLISSLIILDLAGA